MGSYLRNHEVRFEPVDVWPGKPTQSRKRSPFSADYRSTLSLLNSELKHLGAGDIVLQVYLDRNKIRNDGMMRADANPSSPGVILSFKCKHGQLMYPCDTFLAWTDNLRAIALALQALRAVDRYGVTSRAEQYRGWQQLPAPDGPTIKTRAQAIEFLAGILGWRNSTIEGEELIKVVIRKCQFKTHPDQGGDPSQFKLVMECEKVLLA